MERKLTPMEYFLDYYNLEEGECFKLYDLEDTTKETIFVVMQDEGLTVFEISINKDRDIDYNDIKPISNEEDLIFMLNGFNSYWKVESIGEYARFITEMEYPYPMVLEGIEVFNDYDEDDDDDDFFDGDTYGADCDSVD